MTLNLHIIHKPENTIVDQPVKQFVEEGGSLGRAEHCDLFLPDESTYISKIHALIHFRDNMYFITDVSTNGVFVNNDSVPIGKGNTKQILEGEKLHIGKYVIQATFQVGQNTSVKPEVATSIMDNTHDDIDALLNSSDDISDLLDIEVNNHQVSKDNIVDGEKFSVDDLLAGLDTQKNAGNDVQQFMDADDDIAALLAADESVVITPTAKQQQTPAQDIIDVMNYSAADTTAKTIFQATLLAIDNYAIEYGHDRSQLAALKNYLLEHKDQIMGSN